MVRREVFVALSISMLLLAVFALFESKMPTQLADPASWLESDTAIVLAVIATVTVLTLDVVLPIPSSTVMITAGAAFGLVGGALVATVGGILGSLGGLYLGRLSKRIAPTPGTGIATSLVERWGLAAVVATRPIPLLSETTSIVVGRQGLDAKRMILATVVGITPAAIGYAWLGARAADDNSSTGFAVVVVCAAILGVVAGIVGRRKNSRSADPTSD